MSDFEIGDLSGLGLNGNEHDELFDDVTETPAGYDQQTYTITDALMDEPEVSQLVDGIMDEAGTNMFVGLPSALKTFLAMDLGICAAKGLPWLPSDPDKGQHPGFATKQTGVLWVDQDNGRRRVKKRVAALCRARCIQDGPFYFIAFPNPPLAAASRIGLSALTHVVKALGCGLVFFDTYLAVAGVRDENGSENQAAMNAFHRLADETGATVNLIHHPTKIGNEDDLKSVRGHGSIAGGLDYAFSVTRPDRGDVVVVTSIKDRDAPVTKFAAQWWFELGPDGKTLDKARFWRADVPDKKKEAADMLRLQILAVLEIGPKNTAEIVNALGRHRSDVTSLLSEMHQQHIIICEAGARNAKIYRLP